MKTSTIGFIVIWLFSLVITIGGCSTAPTRPPDVTGVVFQKPLDVTRNAVVHVLETKGFKIKNTNDLYIMAEKVSLAGFGSIQSGGSFSSVVVMKTNIWLEPMEKGGTSVYGLGRDQLLELEKILGKSQPK